MRMISTTVFSDGPGGGNPAPVFLDADSMTSEEMQKAAAELGQEAVFVLKPGPGDRGIQEGCSVQKDCDVRLRYFVPDHELSICAHDTIGAVTVMLQEGLLKGNSAVIGTGAGPVHVDWEKDDRGTLVMMEQFLPEFRADVPAAEDLLRALRIPAESLAVSPEVPAECVSTSRFKLMVPVKDRETLDSLKPDLELLWSLCDECGCSGFYVFARDFEKTDTCYARQFPCRSGYDEDPATGIAAAALGAYWVRHGLMKAEEGWNRLRVYQGHAMGRPSFLAADVRLGSGVINGIRVCGYAERV